MAFELNGTQYDTLASVIAAANSLESATITLLSDEVFSASYTITGNITLKGQYILTRAESYVGNLFTINSGATLTIDELCINENASFTINEALYFDYLYNNQQCTDNYLLVTYDSGPKVTSQLFNNKGTLNLLNVEIKNHYSTTKGLILCNRNSTTTIAGAHIHNCANMTNSGLVADLSAAGTIYIEEPTLIENNFIGNNHGIFKIYSTGYLYMNGGTIRKNMGCNSNGVVIGLYSGNFIMNGGLITYNYGLNGIANGRNGAIYVHRNSTFTMNGGEISNNVGGSSGGVDSQTSTVITINDGKIINNQTVNPNYSHQADIRISGTGIINGGEFTQDVTITNIKEGYAPFKYADGITRIEKIPYQAYVCIDGVIRKADFYACINGKIQKVYPKEV